VISQKQTELCTAGPTVISENYCGVPAFTGKSKIYK